jgi:hypothetical protein
MSLIMHTYFLKVCTNDHEFLRLQPVIAAIIPNKKGLTNPNVFAPPFSPPDLNQKLCFDAQVGDQSNLACWFS